MIGTICFFGLMFSFLLDGGIYTDVNGSDYEGRFTNNASVQSFSPAARPLISVFSSRQVSEQFWGIIQDSHGVMYFGNNNFGIQQFDGTNWNVIAPPNRSAAFGLAKNEEGTLFVGARADFGYLAPDSLYQLQFQSLLSHAPESLQNFDRIYVESVGNTVFFCTNPYLFRWENEVLTTWENPGFAGCGVSDGTLYINDQNNGLLALVDEKLQSVSPHLTNRHLNAVLELEDATLFVTTQAIFIKEGDAVRPLNRFSDIRGNTYIHDAVVLRDQNIAFGTNNGIYIYTPGGRLVYHLTQSTGLSSNGVNELYVDEGGNLWAATNKNVNFIEYNSPLRLLLDAQYHSADMISAYEHNGQVFLGTDDGIFTWEGQAWRQLLPETAIWDFAHIGNTLFIGAREGLFVYRDGNITKLRDTFARLIVASEKYEQLAYVYYLDQGIEGLWLNDDGSFTSFPVVDFSERVYTLMEDKHGDLWRGTGNWGIYRDRLQDIGGQPELVETLHYTQEDGLPAPSYNYTTKIAGEVGFITEEGLFRFDEELQQMVRDFRFIEAFPPEYGRRAWPSTEDKLGHVWLDFGSKRVFEMIPDGDGNYRLSQGPYSRVDELGNIDQILSLDEHTALFTTRNHAILFERSLQEAPRYAYQTLVRSITLGGDSLLWGGYGPAELTLDNTIHFTTQAIRFNWSASTYFPSENTEFRYRLKGLDENWSSWTSETYRDFTNLREGAYSFEVQSRNLYHVIGHTASVHFAILPPWYRSWWAYGLYLIVGVLGLGLIGNRIIKWRIHQQMIVMQAQQAEELKKLDVVKTQFFSNVSHELRTPLTLTIGPLEELKKNADHFGEEDLSKVSMALRNSRRLLILVTEILDISRLEASGDNLVVNRHNLAGLVKTIAQNFNSLAARNNITYTIHTPDRIDAWFNRDQIEKIITNLLSNAFKFTDDGRDISITLAQGDQQVIIQVRDSGIGIPENELPFIFDRFYQSSNSTSRLQNGTGIGLALVKHLIELHGGTISVESTLTKGTTFIVTLPLEAHLLPHAIVKEESHLSPGATALPVMVDGENITQLENSSQLDEEDHTTVLVVEDNLELRQFLADHLRGGYKVIESVHGKDGLEKAIEHLPDIIISDVMMPEMNGFEFVKELREDPSVNFIPVILLTGKDTKEDTIAGLDHGANDYIIKPFDMDELKARIKSMLRGQKLLKARFESQSSSIFVNKEKLKSADQQFLEQVQKAILENLEDSSLSVEKLAGMLNVGRATLHRKLIKIVDESPVQLIRRIRLEQGKQMIENKSGTISEIAYSVGFESVSWFSKCFKEQYDVNPSELLS